MIRAWWILGAAGVAIVAQATSGDQARAVDHSPRRVLAHEDGPPAARTDIDDLDDIARRARAEIDRNAADGADSTDVGELDRAGGAIDHVVVLSIDGLRPDVIDGAMRTLTNLKREGLFAPTAHTVSTSTTLPSHASMLTGVEPDKHGIRFNAYRPERGRVQFPSIFRAARDAGLATAMFVGKRKLEHVVDSDVTLGRFQVAPSCYRTADAAAEYLANVGPGVTFIHFAEPDSAGHRVGWMSAPYVRAARQADECLSTVVRAIRRRSLSRTLLVVTADHGGHARNHGTRLVVDISIPWIAFGGGLRHGTVRSPVRTIDTAATVLAALNLNPPEGMDGVAVRGIGRRRTD